MILLPHPLHDALRANDCIRRACEANGKRFDPPPILKLFNPLGAATWLASELGQDGDTLFGLADLGFGCPELGTFSLSEIAAVRLPFGLFIERDLAFATGVPLSVWAKMARRSGSILWAGLDGKERTEGQTLLRRAARSGADLSREASAFPDLPLRSGNPDGG